MTSRAFPRPISAEEAAVVRAALERAPKGGDRSALLPTIDKLVVVDRCKCGCTSVDFEFPGEFVPGSIVADGIAKTPDGRGVGFIVWGDERGLKGLEIYELDVGGPSRELPALESIEPWGPGWSEP